jgi:hypothetical protein
MLQPRLLHGYVNVRQHADGLGAVQGVLDELPQCGVQALPGVLEPGDACRRVCETSNEDDAVVKTGTRMT